MTLQEQVEFNKMKKDVAALLRIVQITPTHIIIDRSLTVRGVVNADRVFNRRTNTYVELTT